MSERLSRRTVTFVIRLWAEYLAQAPPAWRGEIEQVGCSDWRDEDRQALGERRWTFSTLDELLDFLQQQAVAG